MVTAATMAGADERLAGILAALDAGRTVYVTTATHAVVVTPKTRATWERYGRPLFKVSGRSLYMGRGKVYDCIDYCLITVA